MNENSDLMQISQIAINAKDLDRALEFYRDKLGLNHLFSAGTMAFFDCGGVRLMLAKPEKPEFDHPSSIIYFKVKKTVETYEKLLVRGIRFESKPALVAPMPKYDLWMAFFRDWKTTFWRSPAKS